MVMVAVVVMMRVIMRMVRGQVMMVMLLLVRGRRTTEHR